MKRLLCFGNDRLRYSICMFSVVMMMLCMVGCGSSSGNHYIIVKLKGDEGWTIMDDNGKIVSRNVLKDKLGVYQPKGSVFIANGQYHDVSDPETPLFPDLKLIEVTPFDGDYAIVKYEDDNGKNLGILSRTGEIKPLPEEYSIVNEFRRGEAVVFEHYANARSYGFKQFSINTDGEKNYLSYTDKVELDYEYRKIFLTKMEDKYDSRENMILEYDKEDFPRRCIIRKDFSYGVADTTRVIIEPKYSYVLYLTLGTNGRKYVMNRDKRWYIVEENKEIPLPEDILKFAGEGKYSKLSEVRRR